MAAYGDMGACSHRQSGNDGDGAGGHFGKTSLRIPTILKRREIRGSLDVLYRWNASHTRLFSDFQHPHFDLQYSF
jgi:hypothetical protein